MDSAIIVALISAAGTMAGTYYGIRKSNSLVEYRLKKLEEKVDKHNSVVERTYGLEKDMRVVNHRITDLEKFQGEVEEVRIEH